MHPLYLKDTLFYILSFLPKEYYYLFREVSKFHRDLIPKSTKEINWRRFAVTQSISLIEKYGYPINDEDLAQAGNVQILEYIYQETSFPLTERLFRWVVLNGNLENMKWLKEQGCPWDTWTFNYAVKNGNLDNMKWLKERSVLGIHGLFILRLKRGF